MGPEKKNGVLFMKDENGEFKEITRLDEFIPAPLGVIVTEDKETDAAESRAAKAEKTGTGKYEGCTVEEMDKIITGLREELAHACDYLRVLKLKEKQQEQERRKKAEEDEMLKAIADKVMRITKALMEAGYSEKQATELTKLMLTKVF